MGAVTSPTDAEAKAAYQAWLAEQRRAAKPRAKPRPWIVAAVLLREPGLVRRFGFGVRG